MTASADRVADHKLAMRASLYILDQRVLNDAQRADIRAGIAVLRKRERADTLPAPAVPEVY